MSDELTEVPDETPEETPTPEPGPSVEDLQQQLTEAQQRAEASAKAAETIQQIGSRLMALQATDPAKAAELAAILDGRPLPSTTTTPTPPAAGGLDDLDDREQAILAMAEERAFQRAQQALAPIQQNLVADQIDTAYQRLVSEYGTERVHAVMPQMEQALRQSGVRSVRDLPGGLTGLFKQFDYDAAQQRAIAAAQQQQSQQAQAAASTGLPPGHLGNREPDLSGISGKNIAEIFRNVAKAHGADPNALVGQS